MVSPLGVSAASSVSPVQSQAATVTKKLNVSVGGCDIDRITDKSSIKLQELASKIRAAAHDVINAIKLPKDYTHVTLNDKTHDVFNKDALIGTAKNNEFIDQKKEEITKLFQELMSNEEYKKLSDTPKPPSSPTESTLPIEKEIEIGREVIKEFKKLTDEFVKNTKLKDYGDQLSEHRKNLPKYKELEKIIQATPMAVEGAKDLLSDLKSERLRLEKIIASLEEMEKLFLKAAATMDSAKESRSTS